MLQYATNLYALASLHVHNYSLCSVAASSRQLLVSKADGTMYSYGFSPVENSADLSMSSASISTVLAGRSLSAALLATNNTLLIWGQRRVQSYLASILSSVTGHPAIASVKAAAVGDAHIIVLVTNSSSAAVAVVGDNSWNQSTGIPDGVASDGGLTVVAAGAGHCMALTTANKSVLAWGDNRWNQSTVPTSAAGNVTAIAAGARHSLALLSDGRVVAWGDAGSGQTAVPFHLSVNYTPNSVPAVAIAAGETHSVALLANGTVLAWGISGK
jgi:alpha-tubulin suppressor-like RCC1 family protein